RRRRHTIFSRGWSSDVCSSDLYEKDPSDPYRALWLFYIQREENVEKATADLQHRYDQKDDQWAWDLVGMTLGKLSENEVLESVRSEERRVGKECRGRGSPVSND